MPLTLVHLRFVCRANVRADSTEEVEAYRDAEIYYRGNGITGHLHREDGCYLGYLEGARISIDAALFRIRKDWRQKELRIVSRGPIEERRFNAWDWSVAGPDAPSFARTQRAAGRSIEVVDVDEAAFAAFLDVVQRARAAA